MTKPATFDLASIDTIAACNKPHEVEIVHPVTKEKTGAFISIVGKDSDQYRAAIKAIADQSLRRDADLARRGKNDTPSIDRMERQNINALVAATVGWRNVGLDGAELPFTPENARKVYERILPVREQVQEALNDLENFMPG